MDKVPTITAKLGRQLLATALLLSLLVPSSGCRLCANCDELDYPAYGGAWERTRRDSGRVGSVFDPAGARASELVSRDEPERPDAVERNRQGEKGDDTKFPEPPEEDENAADDSEMELEDKTDDLRGRTLDDIQEEQEQKLRDRELKDIDVKVIPGQPLPPVLR